MQHDLAPLEQDEMGSPALDRDEATTALLKLFSEAGSRKEYLDGVVRLLRDWSGCRRVGIRVLDTDGNIPYESYVGYSREFWESESWLSIRCDQCICIRIIKGAPEPQDESAMTRSGSFRSGDTMRFIAGLTKPQLARFRGVCMQMGFSSLAVVPVSYRGEIIGAFHMADEREGMVPAPVVEFIEMASPLVGEALHRFGLEEELRRNYDFQTAINSLLRLSLEDVSVEEVLRRAQETLLSLSWLTFDPQGFIGLADRADVLPPIPGYRQVPISSGGRVLGYIFLKLREGARQLRQEEDMLAAAADVLAGIITRHEMEGRLLRAQRLEMAGRVAGQVAHDLNNLLTPLIGYPQLIKRQLPADHPAARYCDAQLKLAKQMVAINEDLLTLGRRGRLKYQLADLNYVVGLALSGTEDLPTLIQLDVDLASDLPQISAAPAQLLRAVSNLLTNAQEAMETEGTLSVRTGEVLLDQPLGHYTHIEAGRYVWLTVSDTGSGISPDIINSIFDPFFTTKAPGGKSGSGLGLSIVQAIVEDHNGYVDVESQVGKGTTFSIYLPTQHQTRRVERQKR